MIVLISITYGVTNADTNRISASASNFLTSVISTSTKFIESNLAAISSALGQYSGAVQTIASAFAAALFFIVVLAIYLIDRSVYYFGYFFPPNFRFDLSAFEKEASVGRSEALTQIFSKECTVSKCYGAIRAYLGHKNLDTYRISQRNKIVNGIETAKQVFAYVKAYTVYVIVLLMASFGGIAISPLGATITIVTLILVLCVTVFYFSAAYQSLIKYDLDSFIWEQSYNSDMKMNGDAVGRVVYETKRAKWRVGRLIRERLYLESSLLDAEH
jgi:predicted PurR-regulated permease PerM